MTMNTLPRVGLLALAVTMIVGMGAADMVDPNTNDAPYELGVDDSIPVEVDLNLSNYENMTAVDDITVNVSEVGTDNSFILEEEETSLWEDIKDGFNNLFGTEFSVTSDESNDTVTVTGEVDRSQMEDNNFSLLNNDVTVETVFEQEDSDGNVTESQSFSATVATDIPPVEITSPEADSTVEITLEESMTVETAFNDNVADVSAQLEADNSTTELLGDDSSNTTAADNASVELTLDDLEGEGTVTVEGFDSSGNSLGTDNVTFTLAEETSIFDDVDNTIIDGDFGDSSGGLVGVGIVLLLVVLGGVVAYRRFM